MEVLADVLGVDPSTVRAWEQRGHRPSPRLHARLAGVLGLPAATAKAEATLSERLRAERLRAGLTQLELADRVGAGQQVVSNWESGKRPPTGKQSAPLSEVLEQCP
jgi:transcriptional regulator with XRE-family HTH domain